MITIKITGLEEAIRRYGADIRPAIQSACMATGEEVRAKIAKYPGGPAHPIKWTSAKQRRYYMLMRRSKGLALRYSRQSDPMSQRLGPSWTVVKDGDLGAVVRTRATYAKWVQSEEKQQPMHKATGWKTDRQVVDEISHSDVISRHMQDAISKALGR